MTIYAPFLIPPAILIKATSYLLQNQAVPHVWTSPLSSSDDFNYYVILFDHYTKYIYLYPLRRKSYVHSTFVVFKQLVEIYFTTTNKSLYINNGGEFLALQYFLATHGITHHTIPPHTLEHNGFSERRHRHVVEMDLTILHQTSILLSFRLYGFATIVY